ncbi:hypothetical protein ACWFRF_15600 [Nocardia sp. NPDC055165]
MSKYVSRPTLRREESHANIGGDYDYYAEIQFRLNEPVIFLDPLGNTTKFTHIVVFEGDFAIRIMEYANNKDEYLSFPVPVEVLYEMYELAEKAVVGRGKLSDMLFADTIKHCVPLDKYKKEWILA